MHAYRDQYAQLFHNGQKVVLIAISSDSPAELASWAHDDDFQFLMASDPDLEVRRAYGTVSAAGRPSRSLFVVAPDGKIAYRALPFREIDPTSYEDLGAAIDRVAPLPADSAGG